MLTFRNLFISLWNSSMLKIVLVWLQAAVLWRTPVGYVHALYRVTPPNCLLRPRSEICYRFHIVQMEKTIKKLAKCLEHVNFWHSAIPSVPKHVHRREVFCHWSTFHRQIVVHFTVAVCLSVCCLCSSALSWPQQHFSSMNKWAMWIHELSTNTSDIRIKWDQQNQVCRLMGTRD